MNLGRKRIQRRNNLKTRHNITEEQLIGLLQLQGGKCAICRLPLDHRSAQVDHNHSCCVSDYSCLRCLRGILCMSCNVFLAKAEDNKLLIEAAKRYLQRDRDQEVQISTFLPEKSIIVGKSKVCSCCLQNRNISEFDANRRGFLGRHSQCKQCVRLRTVGLLYNISRNFFYSIALSQNFSCFICQRREENWMSLSVDHDRLCCMGNRSCGRCVRGLLCNRCNVLLGYVRDSVSTLQSAVLYLDRCPEDFQLLRRMLGAIN